MYQLEQMAAGLEIQVKDGAAPDTSALDSVHDKLEAQLAKLEDRRNRLYTLLEDGTYSKDLFTERMQVLTSEENRLRGALNDVEEDLRAAKSQNHKKQLEQLQTVLAHYQKSSIPARKALLQSIIADIEYTKEKKTKPADFALSISLIDFI